MSAKSLGWASQGRLRGKGKRVMISRKAKRLVLAREQLQALTPAELTEVSGGDGGRHKHHRHHHRRRHHKGY